MLCPDFEFFFSWFISHVCGCISACRLLASDATIEWGRAFDYTSNKGSCGAPDDTTTGRAFGVSEFVLLLTSTFEQSHCFRRRFEVDFCERDGPQYSLPIAASL